MAEYDANEQGDLQELEEKQAVIRKNNAKIKELDSIHSSSEGAK